MHQLDNWIGLDSAVFYVPANTVQVIWETVFTGQKTQPTVSKYISQMQHTDRRNTNQSVKTATLWDFSDSTAKRYLACVLTYNSTARSNNIRYIFTSIIVNFLWDQINETKVSVADLLSNCPWNEVSVRRPATWQAVDHCLFGNIAFQTDLHRTSTGADECGSH